MTLTVLAARGGNTLGAGLELRDVGLLLRHEGLELRPLF